MSDQPFTLHQMRFVKGILGMVESGKFGGDPELTVVLKDNAGITYGKHQTTENGGGLWKLIFKYYLGRGDVPSVVKIPEHGKVNIREFLTPYRETIYKKGKDGTGRKGAVTNDQKLKDILAWLGDKDQAMDRAQDTMFHLEYFRPALGICADLDINIGLGLLIVYDMCIHSGDSFAEKLITKFDDEWKEPAHIAELEDLTPDEIIESERAWVKDLIAWRHNWLLTFTSRDRAHQKAVRETAYRTLSYMTFAKEGNWELSCPFEYVMDGTLFGHSWKHVVTVTDEMVAKIG